MPEGFNDIPNDYAHLRLIWYHSEPSDIHYSPNQSLGWDFFFAVSYSKPALVPARYQYRARLGQYIEHSTDLDYQMSHVKKKDFCCQINNLTNYFLAHFELVPVGIYIPIICSNWYFDCFIVLHISKWNLQ